MKSSDAQQSARYCLQCGKPSCKAACPVCQEIPQFIAEIARGDFARAGEIVAANNVFAGVCGTVCPHERRCEGACVRKKSGKAVEIGALESFAAGFADVPTIGNTLSGKSVAIVGAGPAGLTCGLVLACRGAEVTVYEQCQSAGGVIFYGIPSFRLDKSLLQEVVKSSERLVNYVFGCKVGSDVTLAALQSKYDAVFVATGLQKEVSLGIVGEDLPNVCYGNDYLKKPFMTGKTAVIGGGNVAIDCARTALRQNADVTIYYRRNYEDMPAYEAEKLAAKRENVQFRFLYSPQKIEQSGKSLAVTFDLMEVCGTDGTRAAVRKNGKTEKIVCDSVISAAGSVFDGETLGLASGKRLQAEDFHLFDNVFCGGDALNFDNTVADAVRDGKCAAEKIAKYLTE